jgi:hypothetical protein
MSHIKYKYITLKWHIFWVEIFTNILKYISDETIILKEVTLFVFSIFLFRYMIMKKRHLRFWFGRCFIFKELCIYFFLVCIMYIWMNWLDTLLFYSFYSWRRYCSSEVLYMLNLGACSSMVGWGTVLQAERSRSWGCHWICFSIDLIHSSHYGSHVNSAWNRVEHIKTWGSRSAIMYGW